MGKQQEETTVMGGPAEVALIPPEDWVKPDTGTPDEMEEVSSMVGELLRLAEPTLNSALLHALSPDPFHEDPAVCGWCLKRAGTPEKPSTFNLFGGVPLCYDCQGRAATTLIRLVRAERQG